MRYADAFLEPEKGVYSMDVDDLHEYLSWLKDSGRGGDKVYMVVSKDNFEDDLKPIQSIRMAEGYIAVDPEFLEEPGV